MVILPAYKSWLKKTAKNCFSLRQESVWNRYPSQGLYEWNMLKIFNIESSGKKNMLARTIQKKIAREIQKNKYIYIYIFFSFSQEWKYVMPADHNYVCKKIFFPRQAAVCLAPLTFKGFSWMEFAQNPLLSKPSL